jgi:hypothetical protein
MIRKHGMEYFNLIYRSEVQWTDSTRRYKTFHVDGNSIAEKRIMSCGLQITQDHSTLFHEMMNKCEGAFG